MIGTDSFSSAATEMKTSHVYPPRASPSGSIGSRSSTRLMGLVSRIARQQSGRGRLRGTLHDRLDLAGMRKIQDGCSDAANIASPRAGNLHRRHDPAVAWKNHSGECDFIPSIHVALPVVVAPGRPNRSVAAQTQRMPGTRRHCDDAPPSAYLALAVIVRPSGEDTPIHRETTVW